MTHLNLHQLQAKPFQRSLQVIETLVRLFEQLLNQCLFVPIALLVNILSIHIIMAIVKICERYGHPGGLYGYATKPAMQSRHIRVTIPDARGASLAK